MNVNLTMNVNLNPEEQKLLEGIRLNYYVVMDSKKERRINFQKHIYSEYHSDLLPALWYCLHLPRSGLDVISLAPSMIIERIQLQHNIILISSESSEEQLAYFRELPPTLFLSEDSCYEEACRLSEEHLPYLGCVNLSNLTSELLNEQWNNIGQKVKNLKESVNLLDVTPRLFSELERSALPITFLTNQTLDTKTVLEILEKDKYNFSLRAIVTQRQIAALNVFERYNSQGIRPNHIKMLREIEEERQATGFPLIITLPGTPSKGGAYGLNQRDDESTQEEKSLIDFLGLQRAIALGGVWLEGESLNKDIFRRLYFLEEHFHEDCIKSKFMWNSLQGFGRVLKRHLGIDNLQDYISGCSEIIAITDFPIGLAILPGFSDPICSLVPISYRPLTPLVDTFRYGVTGSSEHYIGAGRGFKVLIIECLAQDDRIREASDIGWKMLIDNCRTNELIEVHYKEVDSIKDIETLLTELTDIDILVISAHGQYNGKNFAGLSVGDEFWMPDRETTVPPVVILSACHVAPKGRGAYTVSDAFLNAGALAVLGTLIPVNVRHNAHLTNRFFMYISQVLKGNFSSRNIAEVLARVISSNTVYDVLGTSEKLRVWAYEKNGESKAPIEEYYERLDVSFGQVHSQTISILKEIAKGTEMEVYLESVLQSQGYISESFFYIFSGYPENVIIENRAIKGMIDDRFINFQ
ncbi:CHAT domain-containing protein [Bacillus cereus]|uniref:CHAT domain-containing protein n=1 Tax=Bacillus cereus TaxID=1396 RepID=A0ABD7RH70_BACCE|nr:CHAT domain-containing protein [Bacillus cereus]MDF9622482.1 CHAT domain-containing protein [Bacillus cereus]MEB9568777.1 CHAT domain-containing protein [Bacillus cereus]TNC01020.1 CHAT domain-containing protein [Bacillus cereus]